MFKFKRILQEASRIDEDRKSIKHNLFRDFKMLKNLLLARDFTDKHSINNPYYRCYEGIGGATISHAGKSLINFSSYNYLDFNGHPDIGLAITAACEKYGSSVSASRLVSGERPLHEELEKKIADFYSVESSLVFVSGHATNVSVLSSIFGEGDLIIYDSLSHNSITEGTKLSKAKILAFEHNKVAHLETLLRKHRPLYKHVLIVTEGLFSMDGDIPDLARIIELKKRYRALLMVDEAHSLGVLGTTGKGISEHCGTDPRDIDIIMGTLSKTLCSCGGFVAGCNELITMLKYYASGFVYSVGITPTNCAAASAALDLLNKETSRPGMLREISSYFRQKLHDLDLNLGTCIGVGIIPLIAGSSKSAARLSDTLFSSYGINVNPIIYPAVEENKARLRFFMNSSHTKQQIDYTIGCLRSIL